MELMFVLLSSLIRWNFQVYAARVSENKCDEYWENFPRIETVLNKNVDHAVPKEFPFMARITNGKGYHSGILISENFVLLQANSDLGKSQVILGDLNMETNDDDDHIQKYDVIAVVTHPEYGLNDSFLKLVQLNDSVKFNEYVRPACLPRSDSKVSKQLLAIGWNIAFSRNDHRLHKLKLNHIPNTKCKATYDSNGLSKYVQNIDKRAIFCVVVKRDDEDKCAKYFSAAVLNNNRSNEVVGIVSFSFGCVHDDTAHPSVCSLISKYVDWIERIVWPNEKSTKLIRTTASTPIIQTVKKVKSRTRLAATTVMVAPTFKTPKKPIGLKNILIVVLIAISTMLGLSFVCFKMLESRNRLNFLSVHINRGNENIIINSQTSPS